MRVTVLYFAAVRELVGKQEESLDLPGDVKTVGQLVAFLQAHHEPLAGRMRSVRIARNEAFAPEDEALSEGDTLALIPPVAGG